MSARKPWLEPVFHAHWAGTPACRERHSSSVALKLNSPSCCPNAVTSSAGPVLAPHADGQAVGFPLLLSRCHPESYFFSSFRIF